MRPTAEESCPYPRLVRIGKGLEENPDPITHGKIATGQFERSHDLIIRQQTANITKHDASALAGLLDLKQAAVEMKDAVLRGDIPRIAELLNRSWESKKKTSIAITNESIDTLVDIGKRAGASAAKVSGAGGGGFVMFLVKPEDRIAVINNLGKAGGRAGPVHLVSNGVETWRQPTMARYASEK